MVFQREDGIFRKLGLPNHQIYLLSKFEHETLGGFVTFDKFQVVLNTKLQ